MTSQAASVADLVLARAHDDGMAVRFHDMSLCWRDLVERSLSIARELISVRREGPFHVGLLMDNSPEYLAVLFGSALAGATSVGLNYTRRGDQLATDVRHTDCQLVITDATNAHLLDSVDGIRVGQVDDDWTAALGSHAVNPAPLPEVAPGDLFTLVFTSGSTGAPKAVQMSHARAVELAAKWSFLARDDVAYCAIPMFHTNALGSMILPALASGATIALRERFSASHFMPDIRRFGATFFSTAGRTISYVLATPPSEEDSRHHVKFALASEASPRDVSDFRLRFGIQCFGGYSSSESAITLTPVKGAPRESLGVAPPGVDVAIVDPETCEECAPAQFDEVGRLTNADAAVGEIVGRNVADRFEGYYNNPEANDTRLRNGWYWSGDLGYRDQDGVFYFAGRSGEWLRVDAENFAVAPVERILARCEQVRGVAVYAVPDERTADDQVMAALELDPSSSLTPAEFEEFLLSQPDLGTKWAPRFVRLTTLPVGATNKIDKPLLRRQAWNTTDPIWWRPDRRMAYREMTSEDRVALAAEFEIHGRALTRP